MTLDDLASHTLDWVEPIGIDYRGYTLHEIPPNGQGIAALIALGILENFDMAALPVDSADSLHLQIEAMKLAFADIYEYVSDPATMRDKTRANARQGISEGTREADRHEKGQAPAFGNPAKGGTVYLTAADESGMMVSYIQSNYSGFGSGVVVPGTGISLQNRGYGFSLRPGHANIVAPRKRPFHTIIPGFVTKDGKPLMSFGVMGGSMQAQGHTQVMLRMVDYQPEPAGGGRCAALAHRQRRESRHRARRGRRGDRCHCKAAATTCRRPTAGPPTSAAPSSSTKWRTVILPPPSGAPTARQWGSSHVGTQSHPHLVAQRA